MPITLSSANEKDIPVKGISALKLFHALNEGLKEEIPWSEIQSLYDEGDETKFEEVLSLFKEAGTRIGSRWKGTKQIKNDLIHQVGCA